MASQVTDDLNEFRKALGSFTTGVTVVTTRGADENDVGLTANSFNSVSLDPPMVLWSLGKSAMSMPHFRSSTYFAVHVLSQDQEALSAQFARRGVDKFTGVDLERGPGNIPLLKHCAACFVCRTAYQYEGGDHIIFVGEVLDFTHWERPPLLFHAGQYGQILKPEAPAGVNNDDQFTEASLSYLLRVCAQQIFMPLKQELARQGLGIAQYYYLAMIARYSPATVEELEQLLQFSDTVPERKEIEELVERGLIDVEGGVSRLTAAGSKFHVEMASISKSSESAALNSLDFEMRQTLSLALLRLIECTRSVESLSDGAQPR